MRTLLLGACVITCSVTATSAEEPEAAAEVSEAEALFRELLAGLPKQGRRADTARLELEYWHRNAWPIVLIPVIRKQVRTKDGQAAEVVFLNALAGSMPGTDMSMAFLLVDKRVVDWVSCWTYNRTAQQELRLEDVDGDGHPDVAFRASAGSFGFDERQQSLPGDERKWLYAYAITSKGLSSLFPRTDRQLKLKVAYDAADERVTLKVQGLQKPCASASWSSVRLRSPMSPSRK